MPRPLRLCLENVTYHIFSECIEQRDMLADDNLKKLFLRIVSDTKKKYGFRVVFYQIMDGYFHLLIKTTSGGATISRIMQYIKARFAEKYNKLFNRKGPFWNGRFRDAIIELTKNPVTLFFTLIWKISYLSVTEGKTKNPRQYAFSGLNRFLLKKHGNLMKTDTHEYFENAGSGFAERVMLFNSFNPFGV